MRRPKGESITSRGRRTTLTVSVLALPVVLSAAFISPVIVEHWYLWRLSSEDEETQRTAVDRLLRLKSVKALPHIVKLFSEDKRFTATELNRLADFGPEACLALTRIAEGENSYECLYSMKVLAAILRRCDVNSQTLVRILGSKQEYLRVQAAYALVKPGVDVNLAAPALIKTLVESGDLARYAAAGSLSLICRNDTNWISTLGDSLRHQDDGVRCAVAWTLGEIGPTARAAIANLEQASNDRNRQVRTAVRTALRRIRGDP